MKNGAVDNLHIVNDFFLPTLQARKYTRVILMDHVDWLDNKTTKTVAKTLSEQVDIGGRIIWRSAALSPPYAKFIESEGFEVQCLQRADQGYMDKVNMYSSFYIATRKGKKE